MMVPVLTQQVDNNMIKMSFVLDVDNVNDAPVAIDKNVYVEQLDGLVVAVRSYRGNYSQKKSRDVLEQLVKELNDNEVVKQSVNDVEWYSGQYNPPFTIPYFKRNEVWVVVKQQKQRKNKKQRER